jgi:uncharacterized repeat protein (TIGR01451 family)
MVNAVSEGSVPVILDGSVSNDADGDPLTFEWSGPFGTLNGARITPAIPIGTHTIVLSVDDGHGGISSDAVVVTVTGAVDLAVDATAAPDPVDEASDLTYSVTVTNNGFAGATGVMLHDTLPADVTFVRVTTTEGVCAAPAVGTGGSMSCALGALAAGSRTTVTLVVKTAAAGSLTSTFSVEGNETDANAGNDTASVVTTVNPRPAVIDITEAITATDALGGLPSVTIPISEPILAKDALGGLPSVTIPVSETIISTDALGGVPSVTIPVAEGIAIADAALVANTAAGQDVLVSLVDPATQWHVALRFANVLGAGLTTLTTSPSGVPPPPGFIAASPPVYFDLSTTALLGGPVEVCFNHAGVAFGRSPRFFHFENAAWVDRSTIIDPLASTACGVVTSLSPFALFEPVNTAPTARAGADVSIACAQPAGTIVTLSASASSDPDGDPLTYRWTGPFPEGGGTVFGVSPRVTLAPGMSTLTLVVNDGALDSAPDSVKVTVSVQIAGLFVPLASLTEPDMPLAFPPRAFKAGSTLPLKLQLSCGTTVLSSADVSAPQIAVLDRTGEAVDLATIDLDAGASNDGGAAFRFTSGSWTYNLTTSSLVPGSYRLTIAMPDGRRLLAAFVLR